MTPIAIASIAFLTAIVLRRQSSYAALCEHNRTRPGGLTV
jgi:hypothetical protein